MAERYLFFNSTAGDIRAYQAQDFAEYFGSVLSSGLLHTDNNPGMNATVENGTLNTIVQAGKAVIRGHLYENTSPLTLVHKLPEPTRDRIDRVVLRLDLSHNERHIKLFVRDGTPATNPIAPTLQRDATIYEISLAQIRVRANTVQLNRSDLIDERLNNTVCGVVTSLISVPINVFERQWEEWMADTQLDFDAWFATNQNEFMIWFNSIRDILDTNVAGNLLTLIQKNTADIQSLTKINHNITVYASGWTLNAATKFYEYKINDANIASNTIVDINIQLEYLKSAASVQSACVSHNGYVMLYASDVVDNNLVVDYRITREVTP